MSEILNDRYEESRYTSFSAYDQYRRAVLWTEANALAEEECEQSLKSLERERLIEYYQPFVFSMACRHARGRVSVDVMDLVQEGNLGLLLALDGDVTSGGDFLGSLRSHVVWAMRAFLQQTRPVVIKGESAALLSRMYEVQYQLEGRLRRAVSFAEIAEVLGVSSSRVAEVFAWGQRRAMGSMEGLVERCELPDDVFSCLGLWSSPLECEGVYWQTTVEAVHWVLNKVLTSLQRRVLILRYGLDEEDGRFRSLSDVANVLGVAQQSIEAIERAAFQRIRSALVVVREKACVCCEVRPEYTRAYCTVEEAMQVLGVNRKTVCSYIRQGRLKAFSVLVGDARVAHWVIERQGLAVFQVQVMELKGRRGGCYTVEQVMQRLGMSATSVRRYLRQGRIRGERVMTEDGRGFCWLVPCEEVDGLAYQVGGEQVA
jgi:DNA-directed RNA polymerase specialized sigma subunit